MSARSLARACFALIAAASLCVTTLAAAKEPPPKRKRPALLTLRDLASGKLLPVTSPSAPEIEEVARAVVLFPDTATGFIFHDPITRTRYVMTNHHVAEVFDDSHPVLLRYLSPSDHDGPLYVQRWLNLRAYDLTVYEIVNHPDPASLPSLPLCQHFPSNYKDLFVGCHLVTESDDSVDVLVVGHPMVKPQHASKATASYQQWPGEMVHHFATTLPGSSGSPLWNVQSRCVASVHIGRYLNPSLPTVTFGVGAPISKLLEQWSPPRTAHDPSAKDTTPADPFARGVLGQSLIEQLEAQAKTIDQDQTLRRTPLMTATAPQSRLPAGRPAPTLTPPPTLGDQLRADKGAVADRYRASVVRFPEHGSGVITWDAGAEAYVVVTTSAVAAKVGDSPEAFIGDAASLDLSLLSDAPDLDLAVFAVEDPAALPPRAGAPLCAPHTWDASSGVVFALPGTDRADAAAAPPHLGIKQRRWQTLSLTDDERALAQNLGQTLLYDLGPAPKAADRVNLSGAPVFDPSGCVLGVHSAATSEVTSRYGYPIHRAASLLPFLPADTQQAGFAPLTRLLTDRAEVSMRIRANAAAASSERDLDALTQDADLFDLDLRNVHRHASACQDPSLYRLTARRQDIYTADNGHQAYLVEVGVESDPPQCAAQVKRVIYHVGDAAVQPRYLSEPDDPHHSARFYVKGDFTLRARLDFGDRWRQKAAVSVHVEPLR
jgi:S1-C subfamily serine protease